MKIEFDSIVELEQFLMFSAHIGKVFAPAPAQSTALDAFDAQMRAHAEAHRQLVEAPAMELAQSEESRQDAQAEESEEAAVVTVAGTAEAPKRKRRTKAEIEAGQHAGNAGVEHSQDTTSTIDSNGSSATGTAGANAAGLDNPFAQPGVTTQATASRVVESIDHLRACQSFIQQHGMALYNESFRDGLNANIAAYTPEQRSQHVGILELLGK